MLVHMKLPYQAKACEEIEIALMPIYALIGGRSYKKARQAEVRQAFKGAHSAYDRLLLLLVHAD